MSWAKLQCVKAGASVPYPLSKGSGHPTLGHLIVWHIWGHGRCWEVQDGDPDTMSIRGRLCSCLGTGALAPPWVLDTVKSDFHLFSTYTLYLT